VLLVDLDDFKAVNDGFGHGAGDRLLRAVADRLRGASRGCDTVARLGGDEFAVLLDAVRDPADAVTVAERVLAALARPCALGEATLAPGGSVGVACAEPGDRADDLLRNADLAMYAAKRRGKGRFEVFAPALHTAARERLALAADLRDALDALDALGAPDAAAAGGPARCGWRTSRWWRSRPGRRTGWRRWCGGRTPPAARSRPTRSCRSRRRAG
jgi:diguanylate cyclase (GGDEF)-like protein